MKVFFLVIICGTWERVFSMPRHSAVVHVEEDGNYVSAKIHINGNPYWLNLTRPENSVFDQNFKLTQTIRTADGTYMLRQLDHNSAEIERNILEDKDSQAVFHMQNTNGKILLHGIIDNVHISHDGEEHFAIFHDQLNAGDELDYMDFIGVGANLTTDPSVDTRQVTKAEAELWITVDYKLYEDLGFDDNKVGKYLAVLIRACNNRYNTVSDPSIKLLIIGATVFKTRQDQPFVEAGRGIFGFDIYTVLDLFSEFMLQNGASFPNHDLAPLVSGEKYYKAIGVAWSPGACRGPITSTNSGITVSGKTSVSQDTGGAVWAGIHVLTHELCHNLGGPHDGNVSLPGDPYPYDTTACAWKDGYIMSYIFHPQNRLTFSKCSRDYMRNFVNSKDGACLRTRQHSNPWPNALGDPGEYINYDQQCENYAKSHNYPNASMYKADWRKTADELCGALSCVWKDHFGFIESTVRPLDGTNCNNRGGKCTEMRCV